MVTVCDANWFKSWDILNKGVACGISRYAFCNPLEHIEPRGHGDIKGSQTGK